MIIGDKKDFAIEAFHEPFSNETNRVFGRMCLWINGNSLGDINEPACMLNVTEMFLERFIEKLEQINITELPVNEPIGVFNFLDDKLYLDNSDTNDQVLENAERYFKYDFLTNGGESFDHYKSFAFSEKDTVVFVFRDNDERIYSGASQTVTVVKVIQDFLRWLKKEGAANLGV